MKAVRIIFQLIASLIAVLLTVLTIAIAVPIVLVVYLVDPDPNLIRTRMPSKPWSKPDPNPGPGEDLDGKSGQK
jgi:hypothetical protein